MNGLALCAGVGGLELGLALSLGGEYMCVGYVERDAFAAACLVARMADKALDSAPVWDDLLSFPSRAYRGRVDIVSAGFPCQPWSTAGKRGGAEDERWVWEDIVKIIRDVDGGIVFLENVPGLVSGGGLQLVLGSLAELGFDAEWNLYGAHQVGAPHRRERLFILAWRVPDAIGMLLRAQQGRGEPGWPGAAEPGDVEQAVERVPSSASRGGTLADPDSTGQQSERSGCLLDGERAPQRDDVDGCGVSRAFPPRSDTPPHEWPEGCPQPAVRGGADGPAYRVDRLRALGNGVVPAVAALAFKDLVRRAQ